jgi:hypothetical protein
MAWIGLACVGCATAPTGGPPFGADGRSGGDPIQPGVGDPWGGGSHDVVIVAPAPPGLTAADLGRPVDARFRPMSGTEGASLFEAAEVHTEIVDEFHASLHAIESSFALHAAIEAWSVSLGIDADSVTEKRFASYSATQLREVLALDETVSLRPPPADAAFYVARIWRGHSYEAVFHGDKRDFHAGVKAELAGVGSIDIAAFAAEHHLELSVHAKGLAPKDGSAIFAKTPEEIAEHYEAAVDDPVPILVEYRDIPGVEAGTGEVIGWLEPRLATLRFERIRIYATGAKTWIGADAPARWTMTAACKLNTGAVLEEIFWSEKEVEGSCASGTGSCGESGHCEYTPGWSKELAVFTGDALECGTEGETKDGADIELALFLQAIPAGPAGLAGTLSGCGPKTSYEIDYTLTLP